jgi:ABC-2 type transport system permease protein
VLCRKISFLQGKLEKLFILSLMDLKLKYHRGFFGFFWSFFKPLSQFFAYYLVFGIILKIGKVSYYPLELFLGVLTWSWFTESTSQGVVCFINKKSIITQIATNRLYPPFAAFLAPTMNYFLNLIVFFCAYLCWGDSGLFIETHYSVLHALFVFLLAVSIISLIILSLNILLAYTNARYRDIQSFWELILMYGMFVTPISLSSSHFDAQVCFFSYCTSHFGNEILFLLCRHSFFSCRIKLYVPH